MEKGISPQAPEISHIASKYVRGCDPNLVFLLAVNFIKKPNSKTLRKQSRSSNGPSALSNFICGIKEIVRPVPKPRQSNYEVPLLEESSEASSTTSLKKRSLTPDLETDRSDGKMNIPKFPSSVSSPNLAKQDSGGSSSSSSRPTNDLINFSEDYSRIVEERERKMEERRMSGSRGSSGSSSANGETRTPKSKKRTLQLPNAPNREIKPSTILRLEDRDLVVIDKQDIKEAVNNESQVIIVDPPALPATPAENDHMDLTDILAGNWPDLAGSAAGLLNAEKKSSSVSSTTGNGWKTIERNKSANIASHFSSSKPRHFESNGTSQRKSK